MSKKEELLKYCRNRIEPFSSVDMTEWGLCNYYRRADRTVREFAADYRLQIRRIPTKEAILRGLIKTGNAPIAWYESCA